MKKDTRILIVGDGSYSIYEQALYDAFCELDCTNVHKFYYNKYLSETEHISIELMKKIKYRFENRFSVGYGVCKANRDLLSKCREIKPELVFLYRCRAILPTTVAEMKKMGATVFSYNNDDPFSDYYPKYFWRNYKKCISLCHLNYVYRESNIQDCAEWGSKRTEILRSYYLKKRNFEVPKEKKRSDVPDVVFLGHYEKDERREYLEALAKEGIVIGLPEGWEDRICNKNICFFKETGGLEYNRILCSAKIAVVFLSRLNHDTYTRRCFEIPATKTMMLSVYTDDLVSMFEPDQEAVYFKSKEEFVEKVKYYLTHDAEREKIGRQGYERLMRDGHEVQDRAIQILEAYETMKV